MVLRTIERHDMNKELLAWTNKHRRDITMVGVGILVGAAAAKHSGDKKVAGMFVKSIQSLHNESGEILELRANFANGTSAYFTPNGPMRPL